MVGLVEGQGGTLRCGAEVARLDLDNGAARGVVLANGERIAADIVVSNADAAYTYGTLVGDQAKTRWSAGKLGRARYSMGLFVWYFGTKRRYDAVGHHTIHLGPRYGELLKDIFDRKRLTDDFSIYLHRPSATDPSVAPPGCDAFYALSPVPNLDGVTDWRSEGERRRQAIMRRLSSTILPGLEQKSSPRTSSPRCISATSCSPSMAPVSASSRRCCRAPGSGRTTGAKPSRVSTSSAPAPIPAQACPASCRPPASSTRSCPMLPPSAPEGFATPADCAACRAAIRQGSHSFYLASLMLPVAIREPAYAVYAFCRMADDLIDRDEGGADAIAALGLMLDRIYDGRPAAHYVERGFADVVQRFAIPRAVPDALIEGLGWDAAGRRYATLDDLKSYAVRVASSVGIMMTLVMGRRDPDVLARACDLGVAMQLTNIARDIGEDAAQRPHLHAALLAGAKPASTPNAGWPRPSMTSPRAPSSGACCRSPRRSMSARPRASPRCRAPAASASMPRGSSTARSAARSAPASIPSPRAPSPRASRSCACSPRRRRRGCPTAARCAIPPSVPPRTSSPPSWPRPAPRPLPDLPQWWNVRARSERMVELLAGFKARKDARETTRLAAPYLGPSQ